jgi:acyl carrier protein
MASRSGQTDSPGNGIEEIVKVLALHIAETILKDAGRRIGPDEPLISSGLIDSFSLVDLAMLTEDRFGARLEDTELNAEHIDTLNQLALLIHSRRTK